ncbi:hypothetical protein GC173_14800 [bacterium]|nr:hypothetical protein [bacterium]
MIVVNVPPVSKFPLGRTVITPGAIAALGDNDAERSQACSDLIARHSAGDWGECGKHDWKVNEEALRRDQRLLSVYTIRGQRIWIITEGGRTSVPPVGITTVLTPEEY